MIVLYTAGSFVNYKPATCQHLLMQHKQTFLLLLASFLFLSSPAQTKKTVHLKNAIICLTYDDGLESQLTTVLPQLDSLGLKATFFLNAIQGSSPSDKIGQTPEAVLGWTNAAKNGHELANHTLFHACPEKLGWDSTISIENYTIDRIIKEISTQNTLLSLLDPKRKKRSFAFPCGNNLIAGKDYVKGIHEKGLVTFARGGGDSNSVITDFAHLNSLHVPSWHVWTGTTLDQLIAFAEKVKKSHGMGVYQLHGVGSQIFKISSETHREFLEYLKAHQEDYWVTTFSEAMDFVTKQ
jgi:peptidoglycan-N-acetylglucosamine deacetylase